MFMGYDSPLMDGEGERMAGTHALYTELYMYLKYTEFILHEVVCMSLCTSINTRAL